MNFSFSEMVFIFVLALLFFGPKKLPEIGRKIGKGLAEFKRASNEFRAQIEDEVRNMEIEEEFKSITAPLGTLTAAEPARSIQPLAVRDSSFDSADSAELTPPSAAIPTGFNGHNG